MHEPYEIDSGAVTGSPPAARYMSSSELEAVVQLLIELRDSTLSRLSFIKATDLIVGLGAGDRISTSRIVEHN